MFAPRGWLKRPVARKIYRAIDRSGTFDRSWYRRTQVSGLSRLIDPVWHYLDVGWKKDLDPSPLFDTSHYLYRHHDVRASGLNPLFHFLEYGEAERRSPLRSVLETRHHLIPESRELETFLTPLVDGPRVTMIVDSCSKQEVGAEVSSMVTVAMGFARKQKSSLRIISWIDLSLDELPQDKNVSLVLAHRTNPAQTFGLHPSEHLIATSISSALSIKHSAPLSQLWALQGATAKNKAVAITPLAESDLTLSKLGTGSPTSSFPSDGRIEIARAGKTKAHVVVFGYPLLQPALYLEVLESMEALLFARHSLVSTLAVSVCGPGTEPLSLAGELPVRNADHFSDSNAQKIDLAILATSDSVLLQRLRSLGVRAVEDSGLESLERALLDGEKGRE